MYKFIAAITKTGSNNQRLKTSSDLLAIGDSSEYAKASYMTATRENITRLEMKQACTCKSWW
ncbi:hypothetical protein DVH24_003974 [Malus domestica]|uniref:Uncharacterized protein n=1 Tax=Malus domestica TaxID=3750 RepID=A0A498KCW5_MALDO|nr:hypothetical protein DVH24_003974 [Malus domestica]